MCFGRVDRERIQVNDAMAWSGGPASELAGGPPDAAVCADALARSRSAVAAGDSTGADAAVRRVQHGQPQTFLPFADLELGFGWPEGPTPVTGYRRCLSLATGVHETRCEVGGAQLVVRTRVSRPHGVVTVVVECGGAGVDLDLSLTTPLRATELTVTADGLDLLVQLPEEVAPEGVEPPLRYGDADQRSTRGAVSLRWRHDGTEVAGAGGPAARGVHRAELHLATETTAVGVGRTPSGPVQDALARAQARAGRALLDGADTVALAQEADHAALYDRCVLEVAGPPQAATDLPQRFLEAGASTGGAAAGDPSLLALLFNYGRYLLISSSRPGGPPANLQGIWNDLVQPPWSSDYTTNINLQMNYWLAEQTDLVECLEPLFDLLGALAVSGEETATRVYGAPGWVAHHCSDVWGYTQPVGDGTHDPAWAFWPMGGAWLLQHVRERLRFGGGDEVAAAHWPLIRSAAEFHLHVLLEGPGGEVGTSPSTSPENHFTTPDGQVAATASTSTMDVSLLRDLFLLVADVADRLDLSGDPVVQAAARARSRLPEPPVGPDGLVQEWLDAALRPDPDHRHTAHLYFVHPGDGPATPELARAAALSLEGRGDESTGWSLVWKAAMRARLRQPERVSDLFDLLFRDATVDRGPFAGGLYPNLFAAHPPFQIDANLGFVAAVAECLLQSHTGVVDLLPCLPVELASGRVTGLVARPGLLVDLEWEGGRLGHVRLRARPGAAGEHLVRWDGHELTVAVGADGWTSLTPEDFTRREVGA